GAFHEETGYWLWDAAARQVLRCFIVPRGVTVLAGGTVEPDATSFQIAAVAGSDTYGICSNQFLDREFKTVRYELTMTMHGSDSFTYTEDTQLRMKGRSDLFHHTDTNRVTRVR
ncbi:MAG: FABP family protein, partial [Nitrospira sp.]|nr:FABP family protein [Nitrospira sp.]